MAESVQAESVEALVSARDEAIVTARKRAEQLTKEWLLSCSKIKTEASVNSTGYQNTFTTLARLRIFQESQEFVDTLLKSPLVETLSPASKKWLMRSLNAWSIYSVNRIGIRSSGAETGDADLDAPTALYRANCVDLVSEKVPTHPAFSYNGTLYENRYSAAMVALMVKSVLQSLSFIDKACISLMPSSHITVLRTFKVTDTFATTAPAAPQAGEVFAQVDPQVLARAMSDEIIQAVNQFNAEPSSFSFEVRRDGNDMVNEVRMMHRAVQRNQMLSVLALRPRNRWESGMAYLYNATKGTIREVSHTPEALCVSVSAADVQDMERTAAFIKFLARYMRCKMVP